MSRARRQLPALPPLSPPLLSLLAALLLACGCSEQPDPALPTPWPEQLCLPPDTGRDAGQDEGGGGALPVCLSCSGPIGDEELAAAEPPLPLLPEPGRYAAWLAASLPMLAEPDDAAAWEAQRDELRSRLQRALGYDLLPPPGTAVAARSQGTVERGDLAVELLLLEGHPGMWVSALLFSPLDATDGEPLPGVLLHHGHMSPGKTHRTVLSLAADLARAGLRVLVPDWLDFGDLGCWENSHWLADANLLAGVTVQLPLSTIARRLLDYLAGRPDVDPTRLGVAGHSGGAETTFRLAAADQRVAAVALADGVFDWSWKLGDKLPAHPEHYLAGLFAAAGDDHLLALLAPRPALVLTGDEDLVVCPSEVVAPLVERSRLVYALYDAAGALEHRGFPGGHVLSLAKREAICSFFKAQLLGDGEPCREEASGFADEPELRLTVPADGLTLADVVRAHVTQARAAAPAPGEERTACLAGLLGQRGPSSPTGEQLGDEPPAGPTFVVRWQDGQRTQGGVLNRADGPPLPLLVRQPEGEDSGWGVLCLADGGRAGCRELSLRLARAGLLVGVVELRGQGELADDWDPVADRLAVNRLGGLVLALGGSLAEQRGRDLQAAVAWLRQGEGRRELALAALGPRSALAALLAAAVDPGLDPLYMTGPLLSYRELVAAPPGEVLPYPVDLFLPGLLRCGDAGELLAGLRQAGRRLLVAAELPSGDAGGAQVCGFLLDGLARR
ncbi:MAG: hypothetical protein FJ125_10170 [Deltaproteobacteria bacterium]|nr:hypothetical protein [Deltaproteobacteria bacterium]